MKHNNMLRDTFIID